MDTNFWHQKWNNNEIGFHKSEANPILIKHFDSLSLKKGSRIFIPLCGKTLDISWFLDNGYKVVGVELVELAIQQLFQNLQVEFKLEEKGNFKHYFSDNIDIFVGNCFELSSDIIGHIDAIYDRASLVALPEEMRKQYTSHLIDITKKAPKLLVTFDYNQEEMSGPPFSISKDEVMEHYEKVYNINLLETIDSTGSLRGSFNVNENVWLLK